MTLQLANGWDMELDRGPDWLFVRVHPPPTKTSLARTELAEALWRVLEQEFTYRLVLELDDVPLLHSDLMGELLLLSKRIYSHGGLLRICGLSESNLQALRTARLLGHVSYFSSRADAVMGYRPDQPR